MKLFQNNLCSILYIDEKIANALSHINVSAKTTKYGSFSIVLDRSEKYIGVLTDGDFRRASLNNIKLDLTIKSLLTENSIYLYEVEYSNPRWSEILRSKMAAARKFPSLIPIINSRKEVIELLNLNENPFTDSVAIYGLGFVGITLAGVLASKGMRVNGIEANEALLSDLEKGICHVDEPGLNELLKECKHSNLLSYKNSKDPFYANIHIVSVGTPIAKNGEIDSSALQSVLHTIANNLNKGDMVVLRSTVPMGTTRTFVIPQLEKHSGLFAGEDFNISFAPERTVEGNAVSELLSLPQVIGGFSKACIAKSEIFWQKISPMVIRAESLEAAELIKLANNSFRDLSFAFANQITMLCEEANCDAADVIKNANTGYPRNKIPLPSPGVGGYCLTKDPYLLESSFPVNKRPGMQIIGRKINEEAAFLPIKKIKAFSKKINKNITDFKILIVGFAFKGIPATNDYRGSSSLNLYNKLINEEIYTDVWDAVIKYEDLISNGFSAIKNIDDKISKYDAIIIMNNHPMNKTVESYLPDSSGMLIFDGWNILNKNLITSRENLTFSNLGFFEY